MPGDIFHDDACFEQLLTLTNCRALQLVAATAAATAAAAIVVVAGVLMGCNSHFVHVHNSPDISLASLHRIKGTSPAWYRKSKDAYFLSKKDCSEDSLIIRRRQDSARNATLLPTDSRVLRRININLQFCGKLHGAYLKMQAFQPSADLRIFVACRRVRHCQQIIRVKHV